jgi:hypothetical protein
MDEKIIFTTCTTGYLAQAKSLGDSIAQTNRGYKLCIGLVDKINGRFDPSIFSPYDIVEIETINIPPFDDMKRRYSSLELCCAVKSWMALYLFTKYNVQQVIYMDADILVFSSMEFIEKQSKEFSILLAPHIVSPLPNDGKRPHEMGILKTGIYNAGFFAVRNDQTGNAFLNWWKDILVDYCYEDGKNGLASDQSWLNFVPLFFRDVKIIDHPGCNAAYWNLHERSIEENGDGYLVNKEFPLLFFHFSGYSIHHPSLISRHQDRFSMEDNFAIKKIFNIYHRALLQNGHEWFQKIPFYYKKKMKWLRWKK